MTGNAKSPNIWKANHTVIVENQEAGVGKIGNFSSRTGLSFALDVLYMLLFVKDYDENLETIQTFIGGRERPDW